LVGKAAPVARGLLGVAAPVVSGIARPVARGLVGKAAPVVQPVVDVVAPVVSEVAAPVVQGVVDVVTPVGPAVAGVVVPVVAGVAGPDVTDDIAQAGPVAPTVADVASPTALASTGPAALAAVPFAPQGVIDDAFPSAAATAAALLAGPSTVDRALLGIGAGSSAHAALNRYGTGRAAAPSSDAPVQGPTGLPAPHPAAPVDTGTGTAGAFSGAGLPAAVLGEFLAGLLVGAALCCAGRTRRLTWWFPEVVVGPG
jgi:hypothetical protein